MSIEYIALKKGSPHPIWNGSKPRFYLDNNLRRELPKISLQSYKALTDNIKRHEHYCLKTLDSDKQVCDLMPFASSKLREYLDNRNNTNSQVPLITSYEDDYLVYISHRKKEAILRIKPEEVSNEFLGIIDSLYGV